jgi:hypothetical protein
MTDRRLWLWIAAAAVAIVGIWFVGYTIFWLDGDAPPEQGRGDVITVQTTPG